MKIQVMADSNESGSKRMADFGRAVMADHRFEWQGYDDLPVDLQFELSGIGIAKTDCVEYRERRIFNAELKLPADYLTSALGKDAHLADQVRTMREQDVSCLVLVLGSQEEMPAICLDALKTRYRGKELAFEVASYLDRLIDFEANAGALGCHVEYRKAPWKWLLSTVHKSLTGGSLLGYRPRPANGERELVAAATLFKGIGPEIMKTVLSEYQLCFAPRGDYARPIEELDGIGPKRAAMLLPYVRMTYLERIRA